MSGEDVELRRTIVKCLMVVSNFLSYIQNYSGDLNSLVALHELYKYINKYYDQVSVFPAGRNMPFSFYHPNRKPPKINS